MNSGTFIVRTVPGMTTDTDLLRRHGLSILTAALFAVAAWRLGMSPELPAVLAFIFGGVLLSAIDWRVQRLPTRLVYLTMAAVGAGLAFAALVVWDWRPLASAAAGGLLLANAMLLVHLAGRHLTGFVVLGAGDVRLAGVLGLLLGWYGARHVVAGMVVGHLLVLAAVGLQWLRTRTLHLRYAFGPSLIAGTLAVVLAHG